MEDPMGVATCPICEQFAFLRSKDQIGYQSSKKYEIFHCDNCASAFASPLKVDKEIYNLIYSKAKEVPGYERYYTYADKVLTAKSPLDYLADEEDVYWGIREFLKNKKRALKILEVGCGFGYLTYALARAGHNVKGIDISRVAVENAQKKYGNYYATIDVKDLAKQEGPTYDLIIFTEVIEHIENPKAFMHAVDDLLLPGGNLIVTTPNKTPYPEDVLWETEPPPVHLFWLSEDTMSYFAEILDHRISFTDFRPLNYLEYQARGSYFIPSISIRNYLPTRLPRLDEGGNVIKDSPCSIHHLMATHANCSFFIEGSPMAQIVQAPHNPSLQHPPLHKAKALVKRILRIGFKIPVIKNCLDGLRGLRNKRKQHRIKKLLMKSLPKTRPTMCAIFTKPKRLSFNIFFWQKSKEKKSSKHT